jgi:hypothetical protein
MMKDSNSLVLQMSCRCVAQDASRWPRVTVRLRDLLLVLVLRLLQVIHELDGVEPLCSVYTYRRYIQCMDRVT